MGTACLLQDRRLAPLNLAWLKDSRRYRKDKEQRQEQQSLPPAPLRKGRTATTWLTVSPAGSSPAALLQCHASPPKGRLSAGLGSGRGRWLGSSTPLPFSRSAGSCTGAQPALGRTASGASEHPTRFWGPAAWERSRLSRCGGLRRAGGFPSSPGGGTTSRRCLRGVEPLRGQHQGPLPPPMVPGRSGHPCLGGCCGTASTSLQQRGGQGRWEPSPRPAQGAGPEGLFPKAVLPGSCGESSWWPMAGEEQEGQRGTLSRGGSTAWLDECRWANLAIPRS